MTTNNTVMMKKKYQIWGSWTSFDRRGRGNRFGGFEQQSIMKKLIEEDGDFVRFGFNNRFRVFEQQLILRFWSRKWFGGFDLESNLGLISIFPYLYWTIWRRRLGFYDFEWVVFCDLGFFSFCLSFCCVKERKRWKRK